MLSVPINIVNATVSTIPLSTTTTCDSGWVNWTFVGGFGELLVP